MSLVIAYHAGPTRYAMAADSRASTEGGMTMDTPKAFHVKPYYLVGYAGSLFGAQVVHEVLEPLLHRGHELAGPRRTAETRGHVERLMRQAHREALVHCGPPETGRYPGSGVEVMVVCPAGIATMDEAGAVVWATGRYWAIGCADGYAMGYLDGWDREPVDVGLDAWLETPINCAARRYPGVGGKVVVMEVGSVDP